MQAIRRIFNKEHRYHYTDWILLLLLIYCILCLLGLVFSYSTDLGGMEFSFLYQVQYLEKYKNLYRNSDAYPFFIFYYPPLYPYLQYFVFKLFKVQVYYDIHKALILGRFLSFVLLFIDAVLLSRILQLFTKSKPEKRKILLVFMLLLPIHYFTFRPDSLKVTFFIFFLLYSLKYQFFDPKKKYMWMATFFGLTGVFFKHDLAIYIMAYYGCYFLFYKKKETIFFSFTFVFLTAAGFLFFSTLFGPYLFKNLFKYNIQYSSDIRLNLMLILLNIVRTLPLTILTYLNIRSADKRVRLIAFTAFVFFIISNVSLIRIGSYLNYTYESVILLIINFFLYLQTRDPEKYRLSFVLLAFFLLLFNKHLRDSSVFEKARTDRERSEYNNNLLLSREISKTVGDSIVFFTNGKYIVYNSPLNLMYGYDLHLERFTDLYLHEPIKSRMFSNPSMAKYDELFRSGFVKYVIIENTPVAHEQIRKFYKNYYFYKQIGTLQVYQNQ